MPIGSEILPYNLFKLVLVIWTTFCSWNHEKFSKKKYADSELGYKLPFALQWDFASSFSTGNFFFAPESPWWLVKKRKV
ncbi:BGN_3a_G0031080.mRNA.1.CDS.1 [Saccharomyces cerevisiae]|nr:BGN_3a_G0031080.mRNA.1.CDS.1 [Saccharomyces cerevisiae]CAI7190631.1 BGN_3a_G0031080.mRNA.1.CDS.1 [Saccharomyces cerevisiae]